MKKKRLSKTLVIVLLIIIISKNFITVEASVPGQNTNPPGQEPTEVSEIINREVEEVNPHFSIEKLTFADGSVAESIIINGPPNPPPGYGPESAIVVDDYETFAAEQTGILNNFPSYDWVYGCSAVSAAMIAGYYDREGFPKMYTGPTNNGVMPLTDTSWSKWYSPISDPYDPYSNNPLVASHQGVDGRSTKGSIDDYWWAYQSSRDDPYIEGGWSQHTYGSAIGDYMRTSRSFFDLVDGATRFYRETSGDGKLTCTEMISRGYNEDGTLGIQSFFRSKGYTVTDCYSQRTDNDWYGGFSLADYKAQIDAGNPVLLNISGAGGGHSIVGYGYGSGNTIYIRTTWDSNPNNIYTMEWGGSYAGMEMRMAVVVNLKKGIPVPQPISPEGYITAEKPTYKFTKVAGAERYRITLFRGSTLIYKLTPWAGQVNCSGDECTYTPSTSLPPGEYKWRIRARVSGKWGSFSKFLPFEITATNGFYSNFNNTFGGWLRVNGPWSLNWGVARTPGRYNQVSSIIYDDKFPIFIYSVRMKRNDDLSGANRLYVRGWPTPTLPENKGWINGYIFQYANTGRFSVWKMIKGKAVMVQGWTSSSAINTFGWNTLKVTGKGDWFKFFINDTLVWSGKIEGRDTGYVGIGMYRSTNTISQLFVDWASLFVPSDITSFDYGGEIPIEKGDINSEWDNVDLAPPED